MISVKVRIAKEALDRISSAVEDNLSVTPLRKHDFAATRKVVLDAMQRSVMPTRLSRNKTQNIEAHDLREIGIAVPSHVPGYAWVPRSSIHFDIPEFQDNVEENGIEVAVMFEAPFCSTPVSTTARPPPVVPPKFFQIIRESGSALAARWAQARSNISKIFKNAFGHNERTEAMGRGSNKDALPKEPKPVKVSVPGVVVPELDADEIYRALEDAIAAPILNTTDEPKARIVIPGPDADSVYSIFVSAEAFSLHDAMWHVSACIVNKAGGIRPPSDDDRKILVGLCGAVVARVGIADDEAYQTPGGIHYWKPMTPEEWDKIPMFAASDAHHATLPGGST